MAYIFFPKRWIGKFVSATLSCGKARRQGHVISVNPLVIVGETGTIYRCQGRPTLVEKFEAYD